MKPSRQLRSSRRQVACGGLVFLPIFVLLASSLIVGVGAQQKQKAQAVRLAEEQHILHVLNRLGFGSRPGDVERIKATGIEAYINQQLTPEKIADPVAEAKVKDLPTLAMAAAELYEKYPQPGQLVRQLQRRGDLPGDLAEAQRNRAKAAGKVSAQNPAQSASSEAVTPKTMARNDDAARANADAQNNEEYRRAIREYYMQNGLQLPQRIVGELQASRILRAVYSERQLQEVMVDFWTNHFNVFAGKGADKWLLTSYDRDTIRPAAMGKFYDLLLATAQSPAMLFYLDNFQSVSPNAQLGNGMGRSPAAGRQVGRNPLFDPPRGALHKDRLMDRYPNIRQQTRGGGTNTPQASVPAPKQRKRGVNENYARELMELHTLGVDGGYTQKDVQEVARCFTGWTIFGPRGGAALGGPMADARRENAGKFYFNARLHDDGEKIVLGHKIPAGGGMKDGLMVLDILAHHPSTAKFIATKLARHFVMDNPPPALVERVAAVFTETDGNIRETLRAIFFAPEFNSTQAYRAKVKRPFELAVSTIRTLGADTNGGPQLQQWLARMGEPLYGFQTPNGYADTAESWVNTGGLLERLNFGLALASNRIPGTRVDLSRFVTDFGKGESVNQARIMDQCLKIIVAGDISPKTRETLMKQLNQQTMVTSSPPTAPAGQTEPVSDIDPGPRLRRRQLARVDINITDPVTKIVGLILGSPEFQRQ